MSDERLRNYAFILYPESAPENWLDLIRGFHVPAAVSPLHDSDLKDDGTVKKPHHHVILAFTRMKTVNQVLSLIEPLGVQYVDPVHDLRAYTRYLAHLDEPESGSKAIYDPDDIIALSGFDLGIMTAPTLSQRRAARNEILAFIRECNITEYADLVNYAMDSENWAWLDYIEGHTVFLRGYLNSARFGVNQAQAPGE